MHVSKPDENDVVVSSTFEHCPCECPCGVSLVAPTEFEDFCVFREQVPVLQDEWGRHSIN